MYCQSSHLVGEAGIVNVRDEDTRHLRIHIQIRNPIVRKVLFLSSTKPLDFMFSNDMYESVFYYMCCIQHDIFSAYVDVLYSKGKFLEVAEIVRDMEPSIERVEITPHAKNLVRAKLCSLTHWVPDSTGRVNVVENKCKLERQWIDSPCYVGTPGFFRQPYPLFYFGEHPSLELNSLKLNGSYHFLNPFLWDLGGNSTEQRSMCNAAIKFFRRIAKVDPDYLILFALKHVLRRHGGMIIPGKKTSVVYHLTCEPFTYVFQMVNFPGGQPREFAYAPFHAINRSVPYWELVVYHSDNLDEPLNPDLLDTIRQLQGDDD